MNLGKTIAIAFFLLSVGLTELTSAQQATWIWYPGDYEVWLSNKMQNRRTERGAFYPPFWRLYSPYNLVDFYKKCDLTTGDDVEIVAEGEYSVTIDGKLVAGRPEKVAVPAGKHDFHVKVFNQATVPTVHVKGRQIISDSTWRVTCGDKEWIDEAGKASDISATAWVTVGCWNFNDPGTPPSSFRLNTRAEPAQTTEKTEKGVLVDFGKETFGYVKFHGLQGTGKLVLYYGESKEEALAIETCETLDKIAVNASGKEDLALEQSRAFRYVFVVPDASVSFDSVSMLYEFSPLDERGQFRCSDQEINKIWDVAAYTLHLNTREFFIDGIKRDRWIWSGDAYQSYLMNYYLFFDAPTVKRTLLALRGKDPVTSHINTIMDYTFYWFLGIYDYYQYTGDKAFVRQLYPRMQSMMNFCLSRRNKDGLLEGLPGDWLFIDWADGLSKQGELSFEQLLFCRSLETMALCAEIVGNAEDAAQYRKLAADLKAKFFAYYWDEGKHVIVHSRIDGNRTNNVTRYSNMFAIFFGYLDDGQQQAVKKHVLLNDSIQKITTPYMRFYELEALCALGEQKYVLKEMKDYWGGMLALGATSFWEKYDPTEKGAAHYSMYGHPFGRSLCHAWGASPIYLLGKYYLGVRPLSPGYQTFLVEPNLGGLQWMEGTVPTAHGDIHVFCNTEQMKVKTDTGTGTLRFKSSIEPVSEGNPIQSKGNRQYEMTIEANKEYTVKYKVE